MHEWYVTCWSCGNTINASDAICCQYCGACLFCRNENKGGRDGEIESSSQG